MRTVKEIEQEIEAQKARIAVLETERRMVIKMDPDRRMAEQMHSMFCTWNHIDGCDWHYGSWEKPTHAHGKWLKKAKEAISQGLTIEEIKRVHDLTRG